MALVDVTQHMARLREALATLLVPHELRDHPEATPLVRRGASVAFDDVSFSYPDGRQVFTHFNLRLAPGQRVGLVGRSGSGKSTLLALLQRFYDVQRGRILIDGQDISRVTQQSLRDAISVVPQDISLFHRSVMENIRYGRPNASDAEVLQAAAPPVPRFHRGPARRLRDAGRRARREAVGRPAPAHRDRPRLPEGRADLLLDEATSALDIDSEEAIREALGRLMQSRTVIAIAHRLSTLRSFDRIVVLQEGRLHEDGPPDTLMRRKGLYRELVMREMNRGSPHTPPPPPPPPGLNPVPPRPAFLRFFNLLLRHLRHLPLARGGQNTRNNSPRMVPRVMESEHRPLYPTSAARRSRARAAVL